MCLDERRQTINEHEDEDGISNAMIVLHGGTQSTSNAVIP